MGRTIALMQNARIASPCPVAWEDMTGDERVRYCGHCRKNVYNLVGMEPDAAAALVREKHDDLCARSFVRGDGTLLIGNCPVGLAAARRRLRWLVSGLAAGLGLVVSLGAALGMRLPASAHRRLSDMEPFARLANWFSPKPAPPTAVLGKIAWTGRVRMIPVDDNDGSTGAPVIEQVERP